MHCIPSRPCFTWFSDLVFQQSPTNYCHRATKRILRYLRGLQMLVWRPETVDSASAADAQTRKSISEWIVKLGYGAVAWNSKLQNAVALSTCEAKYHALTEANKDVLYFRSIVEELGIEPFHECPKKRSDKTLFIIWDTGEKAPKTGVKHTHKKVHLVRNLVTAKEIDVSYVPSEENISDILTKPLALRNIKLRRTSFGLIQLSRSDEHGRQPASSPMEPGKI